MPLLDSIKQEKYAQKYIECGNSSEAYRYAYNTKNMQPNTIHVKSSELLNNGKVAVRVKELREQIAKRNEVTLDNLNAELVKARDMAKDKSDYKELRANAMDRAKLNGLIVDNTNITSTGTKETHDEYIKRVCSDENNM